MKSKATNSKAKCSVYYFDLYGKKESKYDFLWKNTIDTVNWFELKPKEEHYFFAPKDFDLKNKYDEGLKIIEIFRLYSSGVKTHRDNFLVSYNKTTLQENIKEFFKVDKREIIQKFNLKDTRDWKIDNALSGGKYDESNILPYSYRPFDIRFIYYDRNFIDSGTSRFNVMQHFINHSNYGLILRRTAENTKEWQQIFVCNTILDINYLSAQTYIAPLYTYQNSSNNNNNYLSKDGEKSDNFINEFRQYMKSKYNTKYTPEQILGYIYAILHSPTYRTKYLEFLKIDFPRIPFTDNENLFNKLSEIGFDLIEHHLLKKSYAKNICKMQGAGNNFEVEKVAYEKGRVWINSERYFEPVPEEIWNFYIGGYQVLDKWLKERKKHRISLSAEDIQHFIKVVNVLQKTIDAMKNIDKLTEEWI